MPGVDFDRVRAEVTMRQVLQLLGFESTRRRGDQWCGRCPLPGCRPSRKPSFSVNVATGRYYCHRCRRHGHQLELWAAANGLLLYAAAIDLCTALGREVPWLHRWRSIQPPSRETTTLPSAALNNRTEKRPPVPAPRITQPYVPR